MAKYFVEIKPSARRELEKLSDQLLARIIPKIEGLASNPRPAGCKKLRGYRDLWRVRLGSYRIIYVIDDELKRVSVTRVAHRRDVYQ